MSVSNEALEALAKRWELPGAVPVGEFSRGYDSALACAAEQLRALLAAHKEEPPFNQSGRMLDPIANQPTTFHILPAQPEEPEPSDDLIKRTLERVKQAYKGEHPGAEELCEMCHGDGVIPIIGATGAQTGMTICPHCGGHGKRVGTEGPGLRNRITELCRYARQRIDGRKGLVEVMELESALASRPVEAKVKAGDVIADMIACPDCHNCGKHFEALRNFRYPIGRPASAGEGKPEESS